MSNWCIQIIGFIGMFFFLLSYQVKSNQKLFLFQMLGCIMFIIQFGLMGAFSGCASLAINAIRNLLLLKYKEWAWVRSRVTLYATIGILLIIMVYTWAGPISLLPFIGGTASSVGYWTNNPQKIRSSQLLCNSPASLLYDLLIHSWGGMLSETMSLTSILISIYRFGWKNLRNSDGDIE